MEESKTQSISPGYYKKFCDYIKKKQDMIIGIVFLVLVAGLIYGVFYAIYKLLRVLFPWWAAGMIVFYLI